MGDGLLGHKVMLAITLELLAVVLVLALRGRTDRGWRARVAAAVGTELEIARYAVTGWRRVRSDPRVFTVHRMNGWATYAVTFAALTLAEIPVVHLVLVALGHPTAAWVATALSLYGIAWLLGDLHALRHGGVVVTDAALELRMGVRWKATIPRDEIVEIARCAGAQGKHVDLSILGANTLVRLAHPVEVRGLLGRRRSLAVLALSIDEPDRFTAAMAPRPSGG